MAKKTARRNIKKVHSVPKVSKFGGYRELLRTKMDGGAYSVDVGGQIAGLPVVSGYSDCCAPAVIDHKLVIPSPAESCGAKIGGGKSRKRRSEERLQKKKTRVASKGSLKKDSRRIDKKHKKAQRGGNNSVPAPYPSSLEGMPASNFSDDMMKRDFSCSQPSWKPECA